MSLICHIFWNGEYFKECHDWGDVNNAPVGAYICFSSDNWQFMRPTRLREYAHAWDVPKEYRAMALLLT